ncbi:MAG: site-2 protease family protein, partial [Thermoproteota archaeon]
MNKTLEFVLFFLAFWLVVYLLSRRLSLSKYGLDIRPLLIKWESKRFRNLLYRCSCRWRKVWRIFSWASIFIGIILMVLALAFLLWNLVRAALLNQMFSSVTLVIPGVTLRLYWLPYFLIAVILTIFIHEAAHGIVAINEGISVKSAGILLLAFFLGGFIEPDEKELSVASSKAKMKVFSAGSSSNIVAGLIVFLLLSSLFIQIPSGLIV